MLILIKNLLKKSTALFIISGVIFAASTQIAPTNVHSAEDASMVPEVFLLRCRARGLDTERCRDGFTRLKHQRGRDSARTLMSKCRLTGRSPATCQRLINASFSAPNAKMMNRVKAYCLRNNIKKTQCRSLMADKLGGGGNRTQKLMAKCKSVGLNELECKKRLDLASRRLGNRK